MSGTRGKILGLLKRLDGCGKTIDISRIKQDEKKLFVLVDKLLPKHIYRYRPMTPENTESLENDSIYLSSPESFNDPTDCMLYVDPEEIMEVFSSEITKPSSSSEADGPDILPPNPIHVLNAMNFGIDTIQRAREGFKIACFSEVIDSPLMWSHYADKHKGYALRYNIRKFARDNCKGCDCLCQRKGFSFYPVLYSSKRPDTTRYAKACAQLFYYGEYFEDHPRPLLPFLLKGKEWAYEKEWRFICRNKEKKYFHMKPEAIYLGYCMNQEDKECLAKIADSKNIEIHQMKINYYDPSFTMFENTIESPYLD